MVTIEDIRRGIQFLELSGQAVCVHSSLRSFGSIKGGAATVVDGFLMEECTVLVPTFSDLFSVAPPPNLRPSRNGWTYTKDYEHIKFDDRIYHPSSNELSVEEMGAVPAEVLSRPCRLRGSHPLCSFAAIGKRAEEIVSKQTNIDVFAPLYQLCKLGGSVILIGVGLNKLTLLHAAEQLAGRNPFRRWANDSTGKPNYATMGGCSEDFEAFSVVLSPLQRQVQVGPSQWRIYPAEQAIQAAASQIRKNPEITRCASPSCERCKDAIAGGPILGN